MNSLEPGSLVAPHRSGMTNVPRLSLSLAIFHYDITNLEDPDGQSMRAIFPDGFE